MWWNDGRGGGLVDQLGINRQQKWLQAAQIDRLIERLLSTTLQLFIWLDHTDTAAELHLHQNVAILHLDVGDN